jgi:hypothetical protein
MDKDNLLKSLAGTLDSDFQVRKQSEQELHVFEVQPGFTAYLLDLIMEEDVPLGIQISAAIFFKNRVVNYWLISENKAATPLNIQDNEKPIIKEKLVQTLVKKHKNNQLKLQLATAMHNILNSEKWEELIPVIKKLISDFDNLDHIYTGLICLYEYTKNYRWAGLETSSSTNPVLEEITTEMFPILENLVTNLLNNDSQVTDEMLYMIIKIFKFTTFSSLPSYFQDQSKLGNWCHLQILIINKPLPASVMEEDSIEMRTSNPRTKTVKWCFGNLHRLLTRHGGGFSTKDKANNEFAKSFLENFVPEILSAYWTIIENWSVKKVWLSEGSLYHMISFLEQLIETPAWALISDKLDAIILHVILPTLNANEETIELYEDEPDEYIRRFFDINRESNTADVASINFIFRLSTKKFKSTINQVLGIVNSIFSRRNENRQDIATAMETEGALRVLSTLSYKLDKKSSPVQGQLDQLLHTFIYPELSDETVSKTPWLTARACDTLAMFVYKYQDQQVLQDIFQAVVKCFQNQEQFPVQLTAVDALRTLVDEELVAEHISGQAPQLMGTLLDMSKKFESDILTSVMDSFVEKFAKNLEPYAHELSSKLVEQFLRLASELLDQQTSSTSNNIDLDKEYQASGILNTLTTLVIAMNSSPNVAASMESVIQDMVKFILENAMVAFLGEAIEILESILFSTQHVSPTLWNLFQSCIDSFDTYALEYFDTFQPFFESVINHGFSQSEVTIETPYVQSLLNVCFNILSSDSLDPIFADCAFELIELTILSMNTRFISFLPRFLPEIFNVFTNLESQDAFDGYMLHHLSVLKIFFGCLYIDPSTTFKFLNEKQFTGGFFQLWIKYSGDFQSVYGCKIQILCCLSILCDADLSLIPQPETILEVTDLLISNLEVLPHAIKARQDILSEDRGMKQYSANTGGDDDEEDEYDDAYFEGDEFEADEAELEAMKQTPIDNINVFEVFANKVMSLQQQDSGKYSGIFGGLDSSQQDTVAKIIQINQQQQEQQNK